MEVHNGNNTFFWSDRWLHVGYLIDFTSEIGTRQLGIRRLAKVSDAAALNSWRVRRCWKPQLQHLITLIHATLLPKPEAGPDKVLWRHSPDFKASFPAAHTWDQIRPFRAKQQWSRFGFHKRFHGSHLTSG